MYAYIYICAVYMSVAQESHAELGQAGARLTTVGGSWCFSCRKGMLACSSDHLLDKGPECAVVTVIGESQGFVFVSVLYI